MRVKQVWDFVPLPKKFKLAWDRITVSKLTIIYFLFALIHCFVQVVLQVHSFVINQQAASVLSNVVFQGNAAIPSGQGFPVYENKSLYVCDPVPKTFSTKSCQPIWGAAFRRHNGTAQGGTDQYANMTAPAYESAMDSISATDSTTVTDSGVPSSVAASSTASSLVASTSSANPSSASAASTAKAEKADIIATVVKTEVVPSATVVVVTQTIAVSPQKRHHDEFGNVTRVNVNGTDVVQVTGFGTDQTITLSQQCLVTLNWPVMMLDNTKREDIVFVAFQVWVLGMSIVAILNESIPHIIASLLTHMLATAWAAYQHWQTTQFEKEFDMITTYGACQHNLLLTYWTARRDAEIPTLVLNVVALFISVFLSWRIIKVFGWQTFKRIGASLSINHIYKIVLSLSIILQLAFFFVIVSCALWIDQLCNGRIGMMAQNMKVYRILTTVVLVLMMPWLVLGWFAVRREMKRGTTVFLVLCVLYLAGWGGMFAARTFRWTYYQWTFFTLVYTASAILVMAALVLGVWSRINFGKGLPHYLNAQEPLPGDDFVAVTEGSDLERSAAKRLSTGSGFSEKVAFPSPVGPVPTYADAFSNEPRRPALAHSPIDDEPARLTRMTSNASDRSHSSQHSIGKRFVIE